VRRSVFGASRDEDATPVKTERLASAKSSEVIDWLAPVLQGYLTGKLV
jgi:hypothetical protein